VRSWGDSVALHELAYRDTWSARLFAVEILRDATHLISERIDVPTGRESFVADGKLRPSEKRHENTPKGVASDHCHGPDFAMDAREVLLEGVPTSFHGSYLNRAVVLEKELQKA
jgi:hypothetical protein